MPGIGTLKVQTNNAESDFVNTQIIAPSYTITFSPEEETTSFNEFSAISEVLKNDIDRFGKVDLEGIGRLEKTEDNRITFLPNYINKELTPPVYAERVIRQHSEHTMLVGDKETTNVVMTEYFTEEEVVTDRWWIWAIVLGLIGIAAIIFHIMLHGYSSGNSYILGGN